MISDVSLTSTDGSRDSGSEPMTTFSTRLELDVDPDVAVDAGAAPAAGPDAVVGAGGAAGMQAPANSARPMASTNGERRKLFTVLSGAPSSGQFWPYPTSH